MHGFKHRTQRLHTSYASIQAMARQGDYDARLKNNLFEARVIAFETSPHRLVSSHAYKNALYATRRLVANSFILRKEAASNSHYAALNKIDALLLTARGHAMVKSFDVSVAQDVFVLLSHYLGLTAIPEEPKHFTRVSRFAKHKSFTGGKLYDQARKRSRKPSAQLGFARKSASLASIDTEKHLETKFPRSRASLSDLDAEHVEELPLYPT